MHRGARPGISDSDKFIYDFDFLIIYQSVIFPVAFLKSQVSRFDFFDNFKVTERHYDEDNNNPPPLLALQSILQLSLKQKD